MNLKCLFFSVLAILLTSTAYSAASPDSLLRELSRTIENKDRYIRQKYARIRQMQQKVAQQDLPLEDKFILYRKLHSEYKTFQYDSAFTYAIELKKTARQLRDPVKTTDARLKLSFTLLSSGMYKEALDSLRSIDPRAMPDSIKTDYYSLRGRACYDLSGYIQDAYYSPRYVQEGGKYIDSALALLDGNAMHFYELRGMKREIARAAGAAADFQVVLDKFNPSFNQYAKAANSLGNIYYSRGEVQKAIGMMARAAMADIKGSVTEGVALMTLADLLYKNGDEARAYVYIKQAMADADFYGAKQRKIQVAAILPVIEGERLATVEEQRSRLFIWSIAVSLLSLLVVVFAGIIFRQLRLLRTAKNAVTAAYDQLQETTDKLIEANKIKEEYIGYSFNNFSGYLEKVEKFKDSIDKKLMAKQYGDIGYVMKTINLKKEREALYQNFDKIFIRLFPNFVSEFNTFFKAEDQPVLKDPESLTIELRIFALIRLGISDHEQIARLLGYSVNTIYTYKTKVKNRSMLPNEIFEKRVMDIKAF